MGLFGRIVKAVIKEMLPPARHHCPYCFSKNLKVLGSNAARFKGEVKIVVTCLDCKEDCEYSVFEDGTSSHRLSPCRRQARAVNHSLAEKWDE